MDRREKKEQHEVKRGESSGQRTGRREQDRLGDWGDAAGEEVG